MRLSEAIPITVICGESGKSGARTKASRIALTLMRATPLNDRRGV
jgi:hypothetical protein